MNAYIGLNICYIDAIELKSYGLNLYGKRKGMPHEFTTMFQACYTEHLRAIAVCDKQDKI